jgi:hypothetical protein
LANVHSRAKNGVASLAYVGEPASTSPEHALAVARCAPLQFARSDW